MDAKSLSYDHEHVTFKLKAQTYLLIGGLCNIVLVYSFQKACEHYSHNMAHHAMTTRSMYMYIKHKRRAFC